MNIHFDEDFASLRRLKQNLKEDDDELKTLLNKKHLDHFELDKFMNGG